MLVIVAAAVSGISFILVKTEEVVVAVMTGVEVIIIIFNMSAMVGMEARVAAEVDMIVIDVDVIKKREEQ
jgi:hypothetical protein